MSEAKPPSPEPSELAGRYQIVKKLGAGAFGTVYKAKDKILGRMVAIKTIRLDTLVAAGASMDEMLERFQREARVAAQLKHPNIVTVYDINQADQGWYIAMEFIDGVGLERVVASEGVMSFERAASIGAQVAEALDVAHRAGVVHRDIKPANIMLEAGDRVKVTDFGIAKPQDSADSLTATGSLLGTPSYMSPEQARGAALDGRSDLFSLGCVLYEMVAGKKAFRGDSITGLIFKIITEEPPPLRELRADVPDAYLRIVEKALAKSADGRYQTGEQMRADLEPLVRPGSTPTMRMAESPTTPYVAGAAVPAVLPAASLTLQSNPTHVVPPTAAGPNPGVAATQVTGAPPPPARATPTRPPVAPRPPAVAPARSGGGGLGLLIGLLLFGVLFLGVAGVGGWYFFLRQPETVTTDASTPPSATPETAPPALESTPVPVDPPPSPLGTTVAEATPPPTNTTVAEYQRPTPPPATRTPAPERPPVETREPETGGFQYLDEEEAPSDPEAGRRLADAYRSKQGSGSSYPSGGARFKPRARSPQGRGREGAAIATLRYLSNAQVTYFKRNQRYGTLQELKQSAGFNLDVPFQAREFARKGYTFRLSVEGDSFRAEAIPQAVGLRQFVVDENEFIRDSSEE